jgi:cobalt-zinc-cadmium efflux system protein
LVVAGIGLLVNLSVAWVLSRDRHDLNTRAALSHVWGDLLGSLAALIAGVAILFGAPYWVDSLLSLLICILIVRSALAVCRAALGVLMERVPRHLDLMKIFSAMAAVSGVRGVHNLHVWELAPGQVALSAHLDLSDLHQWPSILEQTVAVLSDMGVDHITLQPEVIDSQDAAA